MKKYLILFLLVLAALGCRKALELGAPANQLTGDKLFADSASVNALLDNTYALFSQNIEQNYTIPLALYTDELAYTATGAPVLEYYQSNVSAVNTNHINLWKTNYFAIYQCNDLLAHPGVKNQFRAEARFLRACAYFNLVNVFGGVPLVLTTDVAQNAVLAKSDSAAVYTQITSDLLAAKDGLSATYFGTGKVRANRYAVQALLARVYLFQRKYAEAESEASAVIGSGWYTPLAAPGTVFLAGSKESILQLYTPNGFTLQGAQLFVASGKPTYPMTDALFQAFESGDLRKTAWVGQSAGFNFPAKYKNRTTGGASAEYLSFLRVAEQYLIRAEARACQNKIPLAVDDLNVIRSRAGLGNLSSAIDLATCMNAILKERRVELFDEWGQRFWDLKRTGRLNAYMSGYKTTWQSRGVWLPIPQNELNYDPFLTQNNGY